MKLMTIKSSGSKWLEMATQEYSEKINFFQKFEFIQLPSSKKSRGDQVQKIKEESELILRNIKQQDHLILFDQHGKKLTSLEASKKVANFQLHGIKGIIFLIGGAYGVSEDIKKRANEIWSISDFVMNHHVATLVALEQIYRIFMILNNKPYHNE
jgi:23S rRNA (pseudouridine1915-N3)-methyltransferase